jgi:2-keto-3-deoxy-6-phosphogluconate aldolase
MMMTLMSGATSAVDRIRAERVVAILRRAPDVDAVVETIAAGRIRVVEVTLDSEGTLETIADPESEARRLVAAVSTV